MLKRALEFHDSTLNRVEHDKDGNLHIFLTSAIIHESEGTAGHDGGDVYTQDVEMIIHTPIIKKSSTHTNIRISDGVVLNGDETYDNLIPYPTRLAGTIQLDLTLAHENEGFAVTGSMIEIIGLGSPVYLEQFNK